MPLTKSLERAIDHSAPSLSVRLRLARKRWRRDVTLALIAHFVGPGQRVVDIGAYRGVYTLAMSQLVGPTGRVLAMEPVPANRAALKVVARRQANVTMFGGAASDHAGTAELQIPVHQGYRLGALATLGGREVGEVIGRGSPGGPGVATETVSVDTATVDELIESGGKDHRPVTFVRCDVVGHEDAALAGAERTLRSWRPAVLVEIEERHRDQPVQVALDRLCEIGYEGFFLRRNELCELSDFDVERDQRAFVDGSFVPFGMPPDYVHYFLFVDPGSLAPGFWPGAGSTGPNWLPEWLRRVATRKPTVAYHSPGTALR